MAKLTRNRFTQASRWRKCIDAITGAINTGGVEARTVGLTLVAGPGEGLLTLTPKIFTWVRFAHCVDIYTRFTFVWSGVNTFGKTYQKLIYPRHESVLTCGQIHVDHSYGLVDVVGKGETSQKISEIIHVIRQKDVCRDLQINDQIDGHCVCIWK